MYVKLCIKDEETDGLVVRTGPSGLADVGSACGLRCQSCIN